MKVKSSASRVQSSCARIFTGKDSDRCTSLWTLMVLMRFLISMLIMVIVYRPVPSTNSNQSPSTTSSESFRESFDGELFSSMET
ncbi:hypothetical protein NC651_000074 [Populus alba x Populus x berolinensis]|nr:hypothetical protein NC651_000074 [Populus alba x Populus x berolinensis]